MSHTTSSAKVYSVLLVSIVALSQAALLVRLSAAPAEILGFWRMLFTLTITYLMILFRGEKLNWKYIYSHRKQVALAGFLFWLHFYLWFFAVQNTTIANAVVLFNVNPIFISLASVLFFKEKLSRSLVIALSLGFVGLLIIEWGSIQLDPNRLIGDLLAVTSALAFAGYTLAAKSLRTHKSNLVLTLLLNLSTTILFALAAFIREKPFFGYPWSSWAAFFAMAIVPSLLGHSLFTYSLKYIKASIASCFKLLEPALAAVIAALVLSETVNLSLIAGFAVIALGLLRLYLYRQP